MVAEPFTVSLCDDVMPSASRGIIGEFMRVEDIPIKDKVVKGIEIPLQNSVLILLIAPKGYIACGYLNIASAEKFGDAACIVKGVKNLKEALTSKVVELTSGAQKQGVKVGMDVTEALEKLL